MPDDLFSEPEFWGDEEDLDNPLNPIIVGTHSTVGGVDATLEKEFTIPDSLNKLYSYSVIVVFQYGRW